AAGPPASALLPYTTLFRSVEHHSQAIGGEHGQRQVGDRRHEGIALSDVTGTVDRHRRGAVHLLQSRPVLGDPKAGRHSAAGLGVDRKSTRLNSSHVKISYA